MLTLAYNAIREKDPCGVVKRTQKNSEEPKFDTVALAGEWLRVFPSTGMDVRFIQNLEHGLDKVAPSSGHGVLIQSRCLPVPIRKDIA